MVFSLWLDTRLRGVPSCGSRLHFRALVRSWLAIRLFVACVALCGLSFLCGMRFACGRNHVAPFAACGRLLCALWHGRMPPGQSEPTRAMKALFDSISARLSLIFESDSAIDYLGQPHLWRPSIDNSSNA